MRKWFFVFGAMIVVASLTILPGAFARPSADPGVTAKTITLGGTFPLSGPVSSYAPIASGMKAYFSYVNARRSTVDRKRGVYGRQIVWKFVDDAYNPAQTVQITRQLVEQEKVFALVGGLGTEHQIAVREYLNQQKVPQIFVSTGASTFGRDYGQYPWTIGWQPDYVSEGSIYGKYIAANQPTAKIAILFQNDDYGKDYIEGLEKGLGSRQNLIVARQGFEVTAPSVASQIATLRASGAETLMIFATPPKTIQTYAIMARLGWKPDNIYLNSVSATDAFLSLAVQSAGAAAVNGSISTSYNKDPANAKWDNDAGMKLYRQIMAKYLPNARATDGLYLYGMAKAHSTVQALYLAGKTPTRAGLQRAVARLNYKDNPFLLPGIVTKTSGTDRFPISQLRLIRFNNGTWTEFGSLLAGR